MSRIVILLQICLLMQGILGASFFTEEATNQFLRLKRQAFSRHFWEPAHSERSWASTITDQASETWQSLVNSVQYYANLELDHSSYSASEIGKHMKSYVNELWPWDSNH
ncbi:uncharacterized protein C3orf85 homolog isoform X2 [Hyla sarda]|uniref:uncharacterized protein C3orf85 homolog isoform X2 n=1 Tax=Hyla sarda TaxID=327740 RepID=UPI0024C2D7E2|nr:uncharacterized protein C3orf85 homolog isoform X2 [Hyla sarda]